MSSAEPLTVGVPTASAPSLRVRLFSVLRDMLSRPSGVVGLFLVLLHLLVAISSPWLVPYDFQAISATLILTPPDAADRHPAGRDLGWLRGHLSRTGRRAS